MDSLGPGEPRRIGRYRLLAELGRGGMGRVLLASADSGELVALKMVLPHLVRDDEYRYRFRREVLTAREAAAGPYTAAVVDADENAEQPWLASEFFYGPTLAAVLASQGALEPRAVLRLAHGLAAALAQIHRIGVTHRDIKPSNVLLTEDGVRLIDFGIARAPGTGGDVTLTATGAAVGAPAYMSPEQVTGRGGLSPKSDLFSLGTTLITAATGANPFDTDVPFQTMSNVAAADPDLDGLPPSLRPVIEPCMRQDPDERPTADELLQRIGELTEVTDGTDGTGTWPQGVRDLDQRQRGEVAALVREHGYDTEVRDSDHRVLLVASYEKTLEDRPPAWTGDDGPTAGPTRPRTPPKIRAGVVAASVAAVLLVVTLVVVLTDRMADPGTSAADGGSPPSSEPAEITTSDDEPADETTTTTEPPDPLEDIEVGDCVADDGTKREPDLEPASCDTGTFEVLDIHHDTTDLDRCDDVELSNRSVSSGRHDLVLCLVYNHAAEAYRAETDECIFGPQDDEAEWSFVDCEIGVFRVLERMPGEDDNDRCDHGTYYNHYVTFGGPDEYLDVMLCLQMIYPKGDIGYAERNNCMWKTGDEPDARYEFSDCDHANVVVTGRTDNFKAKSFCGEDGWSSWRSREFPNHSYTVCWSSR